MIPEAAVEEVAAILYDIGEHQNTHTFEAVHSILRDSARLILEAAAPYLVASAVDSPPVAPRPCTERHSHPDPAYMCMAPEGHK